MSDFSRSVTSVVVVLTLLLGGFGLNASKADAAVVSPSRADTARLLGYMWGDGTFEDGVWDVNGPSGTSSLIEELVERHGGQWTNRAKLKFTLSAPYAWTSWKHGLPNDTAAVRSAVRHPHFLAALLETEANVVGQVYDQSRCCVPGYTRGRLTQLRSMLRDEGYSTASFVEFANVDSGKVVIGASQWDELRTNLRFVCPVHNDAIRIPGGTKHGKYGKLRWLGSTSRWPSVVRTDCTNGQPVPEASPQTGTCSVRVTNDDKVRVSWTFTLGDAAIRRDGTYLETVSGRDGAWTQRPGSGTYSYEVRLLAFGTKTTKSCGSVTVGDGDEASCRVRATANGVRLDWDNFGKKNYSIRRNGLWVGGVTNGDTSKWLSPGSIDDTWELRYRKNRINTAVPCLSAG